MNQVEEMLNTFVLPSAIRAAIVFVNDTMEAAKKIAYAVFGPASTRPEDILAVYDRLCAYLDAPRDINS